VISLATAEYEPALRRLNRSLNRTGFAGVRRFWKPGEFPPGCPDHLDVPFAFKPHCFAAAGAKGLRYVLWLDSTCVAIRPLDELFDRIARRGYVVFRTSMEKVGEWAGDAALAALGLDRDSAMQLPEVNAAAIGLDVAHPIGAEFLARWRSAADDVTPFRGTGDPIRSVDDYTAVKWNHAARCSADPRVKGHRHDQTVAGILAHRLGMELSDVGLQPYRFDDRPIEPGTVILNRRRRSTWFDRAIVTAQRRRRPGAVL
jgi:hypothetical protein